MSRSSSNKSNYFIITREHRRKNTNRNIAMKASQVKSLLLLLCSLVVMQLAAGHDHFPSGLGNQIDYCKKHYSKHPKHCNYPLSTVCPRVPNKSWCHKFMRDAWCPGHVTRDARQGCRSFCDHNKSGPCKEYVKCKQHPRECHHPHHPDHPDHDRWCREHPKQCHHPHNPRSPSWRSATPAKQGP